MKIQPAIQQKVLPREEAIALVRRRQKAGERAVFTNGCFDLLHLGHIRYLQEARSLGDFLILGLNSDESVRRLKGPTRPLVCAEERAEILAALTCIDYVTIFPEPTACELIDQLQPAIYVKGADYATQHGDTSSMYAASPNMSRLPEAQHVLAYGGIIRLIAYVPQHSTTELIQRIIEAQGETP
jgi:D-glycero-beta-D-manno-heptose 1-phosphate adenylyltransferase